LQNKDIDTKGTKVTSYDKTVDGQKTICSRMTVDGTELKQNITHCLGDGGHVVWGSKARYGWT